MAAESILTYKKPGFPKVSYTEKSYVNTVEYIGPLATLQAAKPPPNSVWGDYEGIVTGAVISPIEGTTDAEMTVTTEYNFDGTAGGAGTAREVTYEVEWVMFQRPLLEHPEFRIGGGGTNELTSKDVADIEQWKNEPDSDVKSSGAYMNASGTEVSLSTNAARFARALDLGLETYEDFAPVVRKTTTYVSGLPGTSTAGQKDTAPTFSGKPSGYEWRKSADRAIRTGGQTRWERVEEWTGAIKVLIDKDELFFT